jgi:type IV secretion system protein VirD4
MSESEPIDITDTLVYRILLLLSIAFLAFMFGGVFLGKGSVQFYAMYANLDEEPSTRAAIALGTFGGLLLLWGEIANTLEIIAGKFKFQVAVPRFIKARKIIGWSVYGAALAETAAIFVALIYWKIMARLIPADFFIFAGIGGVAVGFIFAFGKAFGHDSKVGEGRPMSYARAGLEGAAAGFSLIGLSGLLASVFGRYVSPISTGDFETALAVGAVFGVLAMCEHAYRRKEFLPAVVLYVALPGALGGGIAAAVLGIVLAFNGVFNDVDASFLALVIVGAALGASLGVWRRLGPMRNASRMEKFLGAVDFMATGRATGLAIGLAFIAAGVVFLWLAVPPFLTFARHKGGPFTLILAAGGLGLAGYLIVVRGLLPAFLALRGPRLRSDTHGKARWATAAELRRAGFMPKKEGIYIGQFIDDGVGIDAVGYPGKLHLITIGPNGSGKGMGLIVPNLVDQRRSILMVDPKGEAAAITARARAKLGRVVVLNPFGLFVQERPWLRSHGFNPLAVLDPRSPTFVDDATGIAEALIRVEGSDPHWAASAQDLIAALVMYECIMRGRAASITNVRRMLTEPYGVQDDLPIGLARTVFEMTQSEYEPLRQKAGRFKGGTREVHSIISAAITQTRFLDSPPIATDLQRAGFDFADMKREIVTVYLILPARQLEKHSNWLRLIVQSALTSLQDTPSDKLAPPLFLLDEFAQLGYLPSIENAMGMLRGYGVQLWPFLQDLAQLKAIYRERWESFFSSRGVLTAFAPQDLTTAEYLSRLCGQKTEIVESENERADASGMGRSRGPQGIPLLRPEDLMKIPKGQMLCLAKDVDYPFLTSAPGYWKTVFDRGLDSNPYAPQGKRGGD